MVPAILNEHVSHVQELKVHEEWTWNPCRGEGDTSFTMPGNTYPVMQPHIPDNQNPPTCVSKLHTILHFGYTDLLLKPLHSIFLSQTVLKTNHASFPSSVRHIET
jgi:hypothetical protein